MSLTEEFWENENRRLLALFLPRLTQMAYSGMVNAARQLGIAFDNTLYSRLAEDWARNYTDQLLVFLDTTNKKFVGQIIADWIARSGATVGELNAKLEEEFNAVRANRIAVTETTRAFAQGQRTAYEREGITEWIWRTNRDELVCPVCGPLSNKQVKIGKPFGRDKKGLEILQPPAHVNCRCWVAPSAKSQRGGGMQEETAAVKINIPVEALQASMQTAGYVLPKIVSAHTQENGSTFSLYAGNMAGKNYYSTSIYPDLTMIARGKNIDEKQIKQFIANNIDLLSDKRVVIGTWYNEEEDATYIDVSVLVDNEEIARGLSEQYNQIGMFHLGGQGFIPTGGSGERIDAPPRLDRLKR